MPLYAADHTASGVSVTAVHGGTERRFAADHLVCTLPFTMLREVAINGHAPRPVHDERPPRLHSDRQQVEIVDASA